METENKSYHEFDGNEKFKENKSFRFLNYNQTITDHLETNGNSIDRFNHCVGLKQLNVITNDANKIYYFEVRIDKIPNKPTFIGISDSDIALIVASDIWSGQINDRYHQNPIGVLPPFQIGDIMGILIDFKTKEWNGCVRFFKNKHQLKHQHSPDSPIIFDLLSSTKMSSHKIQSLSLYICAHYKSKFMFTIKQFPVLPVQYKHLFIPYYNEQSKLEHIIKILQIDQNHHNKRLYGYVISDIKKILNLSNNINLYAKGGKFVFNAEHKYCKCECEVHIQFEQQSNTGFLISCRNYFELDRKPYDHPFPISNIFVSLCHGFADIHINNIPATTIWLILKAFMLNIDVDGYCDSDAIQVLLSILAVCRVSNYHEMALKIYDKITPHLKNASVKWKNDRNDLMDKFKNMQCGYCGKKGKLRSCIGCMRVVYCNRKCQKYHWKFEHRNKCKTLWNPMLYRILRHCLDLF